MVEYKDVRVDAGDDGDMIEDSEEDGVIYDDE